jgi:hypothetical protein
VHGSVLLPFIVLFCSDYGAVSVLLQPLTIQVRGPSPLFHVSKLLPDFLFLIHAGSLLSLVCDSGRQVAINIDRPILRLLLVVALVRPLKGFRETVKAICIPVGPEGEDCLQLSAVTMTHKKVTVLSLFRSTPVSPKDPSESFSEDKA